MENVKPLPTFWQFQIAGWACFYVLVLIGSIPDFGRPGELRDQTLGVAFMFLSSCLLHPVCRAFHQRATSWLDFELRALAAALLVGTAGAFATELTVLGFRHMQWANLATNSVQFAVVLFLWCSLYFSIKQWHQSTLERERLLRAETEARKARLSALRYQLNPHFLFNSLNAVSTLVLEGNAPAATRMLAQIADLLRTTLESEATLEVPFAQEIAFARQYLTIEQTRLADRLRVETAIAPETLDALVPSMLLQPLIENAVRHGVAPHVDGGTVAIQSRVQEEQFYIVIRNSGARDARTQNDCGNGIGLTNTRERLTTLYGAQHRFSLAWPETGGCEVTVQLPLRRQPSQEALACAR